MIERTDSNYGEATATVAEAIEQIYGSTPNVRAKLSKASQVTAKMATWDKFITYYETSYELALKLANQRDGKQN